MVGFSLGEIKPRQRCLVQVLSKIDFTGKKLLHLSDDGPLIEALYEKFGEVEQSIYEGKNSLDLTEIDRSDNTYDVILCVHILEHIENDSKAIDELYRVLTVKGKLFIMVPQPAVFQNTMDWGYPDPNQHEHYRIYGKDIVDKLVRNNVNVEAHLVTDEITFKKELVYEITKESL